MVQSSCKFYHELICKLFEYAPPYLFSLWESKAGEHGGCFGSTEFAGFLARAFISPGWKPAWFFEALPLLVPCPRRGGVWMALRVPKSWLLLALGLGSHVLLLAGVSAAGLGNACLSVEVWVLLAGLQHPSAENVAWGMAQHYRDGCWELWLWEC